MWVNHISLSHVRNHMNSEVDFVQGYNLILGANGQGKTNIVEAIAYFASLSSHRTSVNTSLIAADQDSAVIRMKLQRTGREILLEMLLNRQGANRAQINGNAAKPKEIPSYFSCVLFAPEDLQISRGEPGARRKFIDEFIAARDPQMRALLDDYERVVRQRTSLLKSARHRAAAPLKEGGMLATLDVWNEKLISLGSKIIVERARGIRALLPPLESLYQELVSEDHRPMLSLKCNIFEDEPGKPDFSPEVVQARYRESLREKLQEELERGLTLVGPHRDDMLCSLNDLPVKGYASHGETWSFVLALRLATAAVLREESIAGDPVIILDDVFAELDSKRRARLLASLGGFEQVIVTAAVRDDVPESDQWRVIHVESGKVIT